MRYNNLSQTLRVSRQQGPPRKTEFCGLRTLTKERKRQYRCHLRKEKVASAEKYAV